MWNVAFVVVQFLSSSNLRTFLPGPKMFILNSAFLISAFWESFFSVCLARISVYLFIWSVLLKWKQSLSSHLHLDGTFINSKVNKVKIHLNKNGGLKYRGNRNSSDKNQNKELRKQIKHLYRFWYRDCSLGINWCRIETPDGKVKQVKSPTAASLREQFARFFWCSPKCRNQDS